MTTAASATGTGAVRSLIPFRMDRLPWAKFHWMVVVGLGVSWILDGLEIQLVSNAGFQDSLGMSAEQVGLAYFPTYAVVVTFVIMVVVLAVRPQGIMGRPA